MSSFRESMAELLRAGRYDEVLAIVRKNRGSSRTILGLLYHDDELVRWRAVSMLGHLAASEPEVVRPLVKRLLWFMSEESSTVGWGSAQGIAEIYRRNPDVAKDAIKVVIHYQDDEELSRPENRNTYMLAGSLWAIGNLADMEPGLTAEMGPALTGFLADPDPGIRATSAWALGRIKYKEASAGLEHLLDDCSPVELYADGELLDCTVKDVADDALRKIKNP
jgi:HEAT repeat protein